MSYQDTTEIEKATSQYMQFTESARKLAESRNKARKYNVDFVPVLIERLTAYVEECKRTHEPMTSAGFILASGVPQKTFSEMVNGDYDNVVEEYRILHNIPDNVNEIITDEGEVIPLAPFSLVLEKFARLPLQAQLEGNCYTNRGNPAGSIFGLKARFNWTEDNTPQHVVQNLVIADGEQARKALEMLSKPRATRD